MEIDCEIKTSKQRTDTPMHNNTLGCYGRMCDEQRQNREMKKSTNERCSYWTCC